MSPVKHSVYSTKRALIAGLIGPGDAVLDVGFWGQGVPKNDPDWAHAMLLARAKDVWGIDLEYDDSEVSDTRKYQKASAENFAFDRTFDVIFAADVIEHLSNPGLFLRSCAQNLKKSGRLIITTPNCYNLFSMASKMTHTEPIENKDHTCYFNHRLLWQLLKKNGWKVVEAGYVYATDVKYRENYKKKFLNLVYRLLSLFTPKFIETIVVVAQKAEEVRH
jgi:2-polyprenyl-3-methyl-5-hydroxy-6-metoxy-1,4-benzoquinol methylase